MKRRYIALIVLAVTLAAVVVVSCGKEDPWPYGPPPPSTNTPGNTTWPTGNISIDYDSSLTVVNFNPVNGKTTLLVQFVVRDAEGFPGDTSEYSLQMFIDNQQIDVEAIPDSSVEQLETSVLFSLVLDASYSMVSPSSAPFDTMLMLAESTVRIGTREWQTRPGQFYWNLSWFNETIARPSGSWLPEDILSIPKPGPGSSTKLFAAGDDMVNIMRQRYENGIASGPRDRHVMLLFTDGADNYSWFDNSQTLDTGSTTSGKQFTQKGYPSTNLADLLANIESHPTLTVHTGGLGNKVNQDDLADIAEAGDGLFVFSPKTADLTKFFGRILRELTTVQTRQFLIPLQQGDYTFKLVVTSRKNSSNRDEIQFRFHTGDAEAGIL